MEPRGFQPAKGTSRPASLDAFVDGLQASGRYTFANEEARRTLGQSGPAFNKARRRLVRLRRLASPRRGFSVIVPLEYRSLGAPPASWFIDDLMRFQRGDYYVGLLSAAALYGAAHQQPQVFQVVTTKPCRPIKVAHLRIRFFTKRRIPANSTSRTKTETGSMSVSIPEVTAIDLVRYVRGIGNLSSVAVVLRELSDKLDRRRLLRAASEDVELACAQRLGYLLEQVGAGKITAPLAGWLAGQVPRPVLLRASAAAAGAPLDRRWMVLVNDKIELDE
jgi:hypothetical protein